MITKILEWQSDGGFSLKDVCQVMKMDEVYKIKKNEYDQIDNNEDSELISNIMFI